MLQFNKKIILLSALTGSLLLSGCGTSDTATELSSSVSGQLVDNYIQNVDYVCGDGTQGITDVNGSFKCSSLPVAFKIAGLTLGQIDTMTPDGQIFPQDLVGVARTETANAEVVAMARFLQSCDDDNNTHNGIRIKDEVKEQLLAEVYFNLEDIHLYANDANITLIDEASSRDHLEKTTELVQSIAEIQRIPTALRDSLLTPASTLTQETKDSLAYMVNEERLAYDVYNSLYATHLANGQEIKQLTNIATKSEATHIETVELLVQKYITDVSDFTNIAPEYVDTNLSNMPAGVYSIQAIQDLHDTLIAKGVQSKQDALEVGCMVEVVDINDLTTDIQLAQDSNASDVVEAFEFLRDASYNHYYSFDRGLKRMGVTEGCCVLGDEYCHPEYPVEESAHEDVTAAHDNAHAVRDEVHEDVAAAHTVKL